MFDSNTFEKTLQTSWLGQNLLYLDEVSSTNEYAKGLSSKEAMAGTLVLTDKQTQGKGQHAKTWNTEPNQNLTFSLVFKPPVSDRITLLTLACASAIEDILKKNLGEDEISLKWPNDVYVGSKKIAGLLTEVVFNGSKVDRVIVGIGLNVNQTQYSQELKETAGSLATITGKSWSREELLAELLTRIEHNYHRWTASNVELVKEINPKLIGFGKWVHLEVEGDMQPDSFKFLGMNESGALQVLNKDLEVNTFAYEQVRVHPN